MRQEIVPVSEGGWANWTYTQGGRERKERLRERAGQIQFIIF